VPGQQCPAGVVRSLCGSSNPRADDSRVDGQLVAGPLRPVLGQQGEKQRHVTLVDAQVHNGPQAPLRRHPRTR
jgi:hypothetical protein